MHAAPQRPPHVSAPVTANPTPMMPAEAAADGKQSARNTAEIPSQGRQSFKFLFPL